MWKIIKLKRIRFVNLGFIQFKELKCVNKDGALIDQIRADNSKIISF